MSSAKYLVDHLKEVPVYVIPCISIDRNAGGIQLFGALLHRQHGALCLQLACLD
jgi:hypothetical protein